MRDRTKKLIGSVLSPLTLAVSAAGTATFAVSGLWWILPLTAGVAGLVSATQYRAATEEKAAALPDRYALQERALTQLVERNVAALERSGPAIKAALSEVPFQLQEVSGKIGALLSRQARVDGFLAEKQHLNLERELQRLERSLSQARTPEARDRFAQAVANQKTEIDARNGLQADSERISAELAEIETALSSTLTKIVALESQHDEDIRESGAGISQALGDVLSTVDALEEALSETFDPEGRRVHD